MAGLTLTLGEQHKVLVFRHEALVLIITIIRYNESIARVVGNDPDGEEEFEELLTRGNAIPIGYRSTLRYHGLSDRDSSKGSFEFFGPPHVDFWREERCPDHKYPGKHPRAQGT